MARWDELNNEEKRHASMLLESLQRGAQTPRNLATTFAIPLKQVRREISALRDRGERISESFPRPHFGEPRPHFNDRTLIYHPRPEFSADGQLIKENNQ